MLTWSIIFFAIAIIAGIFGFGGAAGTATAIAQFLFYMFVILFVIGLLFSLMRKGKGLR